MLDPSINDVRVVYHDEIITVALHTALGKVWIHCEFHQKPIRLSGIKRAVDVLIGVEKEMVGLGFSELWTVNQTKQEANFAEHLGFKRTGEFLGEMPIFRKEF